MFHCLFQTRISAFFLLENQGMVYMLKVIINCQEFSSVQLLSCVWLLVTPWTAARQASLSITNSWSLLKLIAKNSTFKRKFNRPSIHRTQWDKGTKHPLLCPQSLSKSQITQKKVNGGDPRGYNHNLLETRPSQP